MMRPALGDNAFPATLLRELCLNDEGEFLGDDNPDNWALADETEPQICRLADLRVSLLSVSLDECQVRAVYEVESYATDSPIGPAQPRMGDYLTIEVGGGVYMRYMINLTHGETLAGVEADIGESELLLTQHGLWMEGDAEI